MMNDGCEAKRSKRKENGFIELVWQRDTMMIRLIWMMLFRLGFRLRMTESLTVPYLYVEQDETPVDFDSAVTLRSAWIYSRCTWHKEEEKFMHCMAQRRDWISAVLDLKYSFSDTFIHV